ncbi:MAG: DUF4405 domain-containing protein [Anaerolineae bacterium]|nr:DUF4405 domain-containing protein [Thermoflexales bacterium]MDW8408970.1 DUF4405 domain-containing protein [Anaerolineae bacterium]
MNITRKHIPHNLTYLLLDALIFVAFLIATAPHFSGIAIHEWLGVSLGAAIVIHLLLHWQWIVSVTRHFFGRTHWRARLNYILNTLFFIDVTIVLFTGLMISEVALPWIGIHTTPSRSWRLLHSMASDAGVFILGLHVALHWQWIINALKRHVLGLLFRARPMPTVVATQEVQS